MQKKVKYVCEKRAVFGYFVPFLSQLGALLSLPEVHPVADVSVLTTDCCVVAAYSTAMHGYMSVYGADVHHYSKRCRVIVRVCTSTAATDCACRTRKVGCVQKKVALWYVAQTMPETLQNKDGKVATDTADAATDTFYEREATVSCTQSSGSGTNARMHAHTVFHTQIL